MFGVRHEEFRPQKAITEAATLGMEQEMKRRLKMIFATAAIVGLAAIVGAGALIQAAAKGRTCSDVSTIPFRRVGLVLGCSQRLSAGRTNLFFAYRVAAARSDADGVDLERPPVR